MIKSVGIDLGGIGEHRVRCLDEEAQMCDSFGFDTTRVGLAKLEERIFKDGANPVIVFEPTGLAWLLVAVYLKSRHPDFRLVRVQAQKVVALRRYLYYHPCSGIIEREEIVRSLYIREASTIIDAKLYNCKYKNDLP